MAEMKPPWTNCEVHTHHTDPDCDYCVAQLDKQQEFLEELQQECQQINLKLAQQHGGIPFIETQPVVAVLMVQTIADMIFSDPKARMAFEINFHSKLAGQMQEVMKQTIRQQIAGGGANGVILSPEQQKHIRRIQQQQKGG